MLDTDTKRRIDTARDILVGKVPDPKSQVEQITIALIYKFMDDMDAESEEFGGKRKFFAKEFARYGWAKLMRSGLGGHETLNLYAEAIAKMPENPGIPLLFRDIFKNAYLPYRDPETLRAFLKIIDEFNYDHSERLGDAFEYLLSVLGSQGDAGQFRTPRHIIDFMVEIIDPKKTETVLDPACGTAGFLISSYKHILKANSDAKGDSTLTPDEKGRLARNFRGYDISPDMVRLSLVNLYLHGFADPHIAEYDTLTSQDKWNEYADVVLANPPFMSPKGGIKPHNRFSVQSKRSEVLFVDYMAEHLTPSGRAGIIVPEGIIFQSQTAYKQLRKLLVEEYLVAVVSLPAGVFNPYSGVKTSILILDKPLAKKTNAIAFFKVENDGFGLGAQRREIDKNDLPAALAAIKDYKLRITNEKIRVKNETNAQLLIVEKEKIAENREYNLSGERYREGAANVGLKWPLVPIGSICLVERGASPRPIHDYITNALDGVNWIKIGDAEIGSKYITHTKEKVTPEGAAKSRRVKPGDFILSNSMSFGRPYIMATEGCIHDGWLLLRDTSDQLDRDFLYSILGSKPVIEQFERSATGGVVNNLNSEIVRGVQIPLPPLEVQKEIVAEIEGYQKVIDGARAVVDNYRPHIPIDPEWPIIKLGEVCNIKGGYAFKSSDFIEKGIQLIRMGNVKKMLFDHQNSPAFLPNSFKNDYGSYVIKKGDILISMTGTIDKEDYGNVCIIDIEGDFLLNQRVGKFVIDASKFNPSFIYYFAQSARFRRSLFSNSSGGVRQANISNKGIEEVKIPLPPLATQQSIVAEIEAEQSLVNANRELISRFEKKIKATLARVWGEGKPSAAET